MTYRDDLESNRARVRALEAELARLEKEEATIAELLGPKATAMDRVAGGALVIEDAFEIPARFDEAELRRVANEVFGADGRVEREGDELVWRAEPEPRPRKVEVRARVEGERTRLRVRDVGTRRAWARLWGVVGAMITAMRTFLQGQLWWGALFASFLGFVAISSRSDTHRQGVRRARALIAFARACETAAATPRTRVDELGVETASAPETSGEVESIGVREAGRASAEGRS